LDYSLKQYGVKSSIYWLVVTINGPYFKIFEGVRGRNLIYIKKNPENPLDKALKTPLESLVCIKFRLES